ncbi:uncharacterized protein [Spinacia oleracea]|uniref:SWIM-type domain-containing protein n=1 Tax=Spinacia oleracea TaxID=3562 RepID=A0ABM3R7D1_SPIOL|nr:uncharacterized protein LOC110789603 [Spinacia oleracea]
MMEAGKLITLKIWHSGSFKKKGSVLEFVGGGYKTFEVDTDEMCWWYLVELVEKCGKVLKEVDHVYYMEPRTTSYEKGLKRVFTDADCRVLMEYAKEMRCVDCYVVPSVEVPRFLQLLVVGIHPTPSPEVVKKLTPKRAPQNNTNMKAPPSKSAQLSQSNLDELNVVVAQQEKETYPAYELDNEYDADEEYEVDDCTYDDIGDEWKDELEGSCDALAAQEIEEALVEDVIHSDGDTEDDEYKESRKNLRSWNADILKIARQLQNDVEDGKLLGQVASPQAQAQAQPQPQQGTTHQSDDLCSEYEESEDEIHTPGESEDDDFSGKRRRSKTVVVNASTDFTELRWTVGIRFPNRVEFRDCVARYAIAQGRNLTFSVSDKNRQQRLGVRCIPGCPFRMYASWESSRACFVVKSVDHQHTCTRNMKANRQLKTTWLAKQFLEIFKSRPHWPAAEICETVRRAYKVLVSRWFAYRVKYHAHRMLHGSMKEHYTKVGRYLEALKQLNPNTYFKLETDPKTNSPTFQRLFCCFDGVKQGWVGCRKVLCVDGCFLKTFLGGMLLSAVGRDANEQMYPLAWAVVEGENNDSWQWFVSHLKIALGENDGAGWTIISDEHQGILNAVAQELPEAEHRHCARHIFANWHKNFKGDEMKLLFWKCAKAYNEADYDDAIEEMEQVDPGAVVSFKSYQPKLFCRAFVKPDTKCDVILSNMAETWNGYIIKARNKHLIYMLEDIRSAVMQRMVLKREEGEKRTSAICPRVQQKLEKEKEHAANCMVLPSGPNLFQVSYYMDTLSVDLDAKSCTCKKWDLSGIPCRHAVAAIFYLHNNAEDYVHGWYKRNTFLNIYSGTISPCTGERHWPKVELPLDPPPIKIGPGRPRINRRRGPHEDPKKSGKLTKHGVQMSCSVCRSVNHNKRRCPEKDKVVEPSAKRPRGRPRKNGDASNNATTTVPTTTTTSVTNAATAISTTTATTCSRATATNIAHHDATAEPTRTGRGGRVIRGGRGSRGGGRDNRGGRGSRGGRGGRGSRGGNSGRGRAIGVGVIVDTDGNSFVGSCSQTSFVATTPPP